MSESMEEDSVHKRVSSTACVEAGNVSFLPGTVTKKIVGTLKEQFSSKCDTSTSSSVGKVRSVDNSKNHGDVPSWQLCREDSIVDELLFEIYDHCHGHRADSFDSDTFTECSSTSELFHWRSDAHEDERQHSQRISRSFLENQSIDEIKSMMKYLKASINQVSTKLVRHLKRRDRRLDKFHRNCDVITAVLQAASLKRRIDTRMKFSIEPLAGAFEQWTDAMKAVTRLPSGLPDEFRKKVWSSLADNHIRTLRIDWEKTCKFAFNEKSNPDDNKLGVQIVKDLHRTGCSGFSGQNNEDDRAILKRLLLAYARWNKRVGYCQGFNVIAALLLDVMERRENDSLKVMVFLIDHVLPESYFANNLRALSVDMAVFRDLLHLKYPILSKHLNYLQHSARDYNTGSCYEPPLTNVFTMQWFLTLFATCLPKHIVLRIWDCLLLEGSEILLRTALVIWGKLASRILKVRDADEFYTVMGDLTTELMTGEILDVDEVIKSIYSMAPFPFPQIAEYRERYTYNITPFSHALSTGNRSHTRSKGSEDQQSNIMSDISVMGPGAYSDTPNVGDPNTPAFMERMTTDINALKKQYEKLQQRQNQAHIIIAAASAKRHLTSKQVDVPKIESPRAMNHLMIGKTTAPGKNRLVAKGPTISPLNSVNHLRHVHVNRPYKHSISSRKKSSSPIKDQDCHSQNENIPECVVTPAVENGSDGQFETPSVGGISLTSDVSSEMSGEVDEVSTFSSPPVSPTSSTVSLTEDTQKLSDTENLNSDNISHDSDNSLEIYEKYHDKKTKNINSTTAINEEHKLLPKCKMEISKTVQSSVSSTPVIPLTKKSNKPFPLMHLNESRAATGLKLGLYSKSAIEEIQKKNRVKWIRPRLS